MSRRDPGEVFEVANIKNNASAQETRRRLIEAAGEVFAKKGLAATLIRDITERAGVNAAAVNYHFRDKHELYLAALRHAHSVAMNDALPRITHGPAEERLRTFVEAVMRSLLGPERPAWHSGLFARELTDPSPAFHDLVEQMLRPTIEGLTAIVRTILGEKAEPMVVTLATCSILGQCMYYLRERAVISELHPQLARYDNLEMLIDHIVGFSLDALNGARRRRRVTRKHRRRVSAVR